LDVLVAGAALPPNPGELIESHAMEGLLAQAKSSYDLVVIDTPPLTAVSDAFPLLGKVDGVIIVGRVGRNRRDVAERLHETLTGAGAPLFGVVANGFKGAGSAPTVTAMAMTTPRPGPSNPPAPPPRPTAPPHPRRPCLRSRVEADGPGKCLSVARYGGRVVDEVMIEEAGRRLSEFP
jgi:hypothetical protein